jgi:hypothetical protein
VLTRASGRIAAVRAPSAATGGNHLLQGSDRREGTEVISGRLRQRGGRVGVQVLGIQVLGIKRLGIEVPALVVARADKVLE